MSYITLPIGFFVEEPEYDNFIESDIQKLCRLYLEIGRLEGGVDQLDILIR